MSPRLALLASLLLLSGCKRASVAIPDVEDQPVLGTARVEALTELVPASGVVEDGHIVVNVEAADSSKVREGERAWVSLLPSTAPVAYRVTRVLRGVSAETGQSLAWLAPMRGRDLPPNSFVSASIETSRISNALVVPRTAIMIRDGKTVVLRQVTDAQGKTSFEPAAVAMGLEAGDKAQILSGLSAGDTVVVSGGIGLLFPEFKAAAD